MMKLTDDALEQMIVVVEHPEHAGADVNNKEYDYQMGVYYMDKVQCCKALPLPDSGQISLLISLFSLHLYVHIPYTAPPFLHESS